MFVLLHVGQVDKKIEGRAGEHFVHMRVMVFDVELFGAILGALGDDVAGADKFDVRALGHG